MDALTLDSGFRIGIQTIHRRTEPATAPWQPKIDELVDLVTLVDRSGYDSLWVGDHISFAVPILDPLIQLAQAAVVSRRLTLGTSVYLLPLRHPAPVAKQVATLDHMTEGRLIFGVGVGGEFPREYEVCGVPRGERGARLSEGIGLLRQFWSGEKVSHAGRYY
jgi:alkanesulfonate monooxygenase SsuD/methylene tetrahydromethanopterin reductase-like flavin-dependent oxidoreductase (luciferase family)